MDRQIPIDMKTSSDELVSSPPGPKRLGLSLPDLLGPTSESRQVAPPLRGGRDAIGSLMKSWGRAC